MNTKDTVVVNLPRSVIQKAQEITGKRTPRAAFAALVRSVRTNPGPRLKPRSKFDYEDVVAVEALPDLCLHVVFADGLSGKVDMSAMVRAKNAGVFTALRKRALFEKVYIEHGAVTWPGELDLAPDAMYDEIYRNGKWKLKTF